MNCTIHMKLNQIIISLASVLIVGLVLVFLMKATQQSDQAPAQSQEPVTTPAVQTNQPPAMQIDKNKRYTATLHTDKGDITVQLTADKTPITVNNFVVLSKKGFYDNTIFHRVIKNFMIQGGDPNGNGTGGPGYRFNDEPFTGDYVRGTVAMANSGPNTNGSQFFIMQEANPLPKNYVIFGHVTAGMNTVDAIADAPVQANSSGEMSSPVNPVKILSVDISAQ